MGLTLVNRQPLQYLQQFKNTTMPYYLYRLNQDHKWKVNEEPPTDALVHKLSSPNRKAAQVRRAQLNAAIEADRQSKKKKPRGKPGHEKAGRPKTGNAKQRVTAYVLPEIFNAMPGNKNEFTKEAIREKLEKDGLI